MPKIAVIYQSVHHGNTRKLLEGMAKNYELDLFDVGQAHGVEFSQYEIVGFSSGIYMGKLHQSLTKFLESNPKLTSKAFIIYTSGSGGRKYAKAFSEELRQKGAQILGVYSCKGYDTYGVWKWIGGISKNHPNDNDIRKGVAFLNHLVRQE